MGEDVISETLESATPVSRRNDPDFVGALRTRVGDANWIPPEGFAGLIADPLSSWVETAFGLTKEPTSGRLVRATPRPVSGPKGAAAELAMLTGSDVEAADSAIRNVP